MKFSASSSPVILGVGHTEYSANSGRSERQLATEAIAAAIADANLDLSDIDGLVTYDLDSNDPLLLSNDLALPDLKWFSRLSYGGGQACATAQDACLAILSGAARVVVIYRAANMRSGQRFGTGEGTTAEQLRYLQWSYPVGLLTPGHMGSLWMHRYLHERNLTADDLAHVVLSSRRYAANNPNSRYFKQEFSVDDYLASPWVVEPVLRTPDCCMETDGGAALVICHPDVDPQRGKPKALLRGAARGMAKGSSILQNYYRPDICGFPDLKVVLTQLWEQTGISARELSAAIIYDAFSPFIYVALEELGVASPSEISGFVASGGIDLDGTLPVNTNGGQLSEAYLHGFNGMIEAVRQIRGESANQLSKTDHILVTGGPALATSGLILSPG
jgi:acetyl-CoA acetyltransferase